VNALNDETLPILLVVSVKVMVNVGKRVACQAMSVEAWYKGKRKHTHRARECGTNERTVPRSESWHARRPRPELVIRSAVGGM